MKFLAGDPEDRVDPPTIWFGYDLAHQIDEARIYEAAHLTAEAGVANVPTNTLLENVFNPDLSTATMRRKSLTHPAFRSIVSSKSRSMPVSHLSKRC